MLPSANRMTRSADFGSVMRGGRRARSGSLVLHVGAVDTTPDRPLVGLVVSRSVGGSVVRNRVSRRLRAQLASRLDALPDEAAVVRALPAASAASSRQLGDDLDRAMAKLAGRR